MIMQLADKINDNLKLGIKKENYQYQCTYAWSVFLNIFAKYHCIFFIITIFFMNIVAFNYEKKTDSIIIALIFDVLLLIYLFPTFFNRYASPRLKKTVKYKIKKFDEKIDDFCNRSIDLISLPFIKIGEIPGKVLKISLEKLCKKIDTE